MALGPNHKRAPSSRRLVLTWLSSASPVLSWSSARLCTATFGSAVYRIIMSRARLRRCVLRPWPSVYRRSPRGAAPIRWVCRRRRGSDGESSLWAIIARWNEVIRDVAEMGYIPSFCTAC